MSDHENKFFTARYPYRYEEAPVDYFNGLPNAIDFIQSLDKSDAINFMNDFIAACQLCNPLRSITETALVLVTSETCGIPEVEAFVFKEDNNGTTITFASFTFSPIISGHAV